MKLLLVGGGAFGGFVSGFGSREFCVPEMRRRGMPLAVLKTGGAVFLFFFHR